LFVSQKPSFTLGVEICEDLWAVIPPSSFMALHGANIIVNLSASNDLVAKSEYRRQLVAQQSARCISGYVYSSSGVYESTTDLVFGGECIIAENGGILQTSGRFQRDDVLIFTDIDIARISTERIGNKSYADNFDIDGKYKNYRVVQVNYNSEYQTDKENFDRKVPAYPFVPDNPVVIDERCEEIFNIQVAGLSKRLEHTGATKAVIGVSGGLDSTLALLVISRTFEVLGIPPENIWSVTMPGFGTSDQTYNNALRLMKSLHSNISEIDIKSACIQHFRDIGHDPEKHDITYENAQARERTQILMDIANEINGLVIGTGDLSELALGWATYNGDHMSHYAINSGIPKTLVRFLVRWVADHVVKGEIKDILYDILDTPISPELLPPDTKGEITQKTEDVIGPYELHDFFLYYVVRHGMQPRKISFLAETAFGDKYSQEEINKWLKVFYKRFFSQQFKRSCLPDGPKVGTLNLSPRGDWRMPSDAEVDLWIKELE